MMDRTPPFFEDRSCPTRYRHRNHRPLAIGSGEDWPQVPRPTGQGLAPDAKLPTEWRATKNVAWKKDIPGVGWLTRRRRRQDCLTTAVAASDAKATDYSLRALCLDAKSGNTLCNVEVFLEKGGPGRTQKQPRQPDADSRR